MNYNGPTIRAIARCLGLTREIVHEILLWCTRVHRYALAVACGLGHKPLKHVGVFQQLLLDYTQVGNTSGLNWIGNKHWSGREPDVAFSRDDLVLVQWFASNRWITITDSWMLMAWTFGATKCATWMREILTRCRINKHLLKLDFTQPYSHGQVVACYTITEY
jgi:hypothetical protein